MKMYLLYLRISLCFYDHEKLSDLYCYFLDLITFSSRHHQKMNYKNNKIIQLKMSKNKSFFQHLIIQICFSGAF